MDNLGVNLYKIQMMYFFKENSDFKAFELIVRLYHQFKDIFINSEPQSLPIPDDAPDDVPRCTAPSPATDAGGRKRAGQRLSARSPRRAGSCRT